MYSTVSILHSNIWNDGEVLVGMETHEHIHIYSSIKTSKMHKISNRYQTYEAQNTQKQQTYEWSGENGISVIRPICTSHKNPTYISPESEREITWDNIMNNYIIKTWPKTIVLCSIPVKNSQYFVKYTYTYIHIHVKHQKSSRHEHT